jgi:hypothetical protein
MIYICILRWKYRRLIALHSHFQPICNFKMFKNSGSDPGRLRPDPGQIQTRITSDQILIRPDQDRTQAGPPEQMEKPNSDQTTGQKKT